MDYLYRLKVQIEFEIFTNYYQEKNKINIKHSNEELKNQDRQISKKKN